MSILFQIILVLVSVLTIVMILRQIRKAKVQIHDTLFWLFFSGLLLLFSLFPRLADWLSHLIGIASPVNFIFLLIIFCLIVHQFFLSVKLSLLDNKVKELVQMLALANHQTKDNQKKDEEL